LVAGNLYTTIKINPDLPTVFASLQTMPRRRSVPSEPNELSIALTDPADIDLVRFEKNLLSWGFFGAHDNRRSRPTRREIVREVPIGDQRRVATAIFEAPASIGLPTTADRDKFLAFTKIVMEDRNKVGILKNPIRFTAARMVQELGLTKSGHLYDDINEWGERMAKTTIDSKDVIYRRGSKRYTNTTEHVFRKFQRVGEDSNSDRTEVYEVWVEDWLLENLNEMYVVREDFNAYKRLKRPTAKGLFGYLHIWFNASKGQPIERSYSTMCQYLNVPVYKFPAKIQETMGKALDELISIDYLSRWNLGRLVLGDGFKITMGPGKELLRVLEITQKRLRSGSEGTSTGVVEDSTVVAELVEIGITRTKAMQLATLGPEDELLDRIDYIRSLLHSKRNKIENPAGFAIKLLESRTPVPEYFVSSRQRQVIIDAQRAERENQQQALIDTLAYEQWCKKRVAQTISDKYRDEQLQLILAAKLPELSQEFPELRRMPMQAQLQQARLVLERELRDQLELPSEDEWKEMDEYKAAQVSLF
jgi:hypothetical protein